MSEPRKVNSKVLAGSRRRRIPVLLAAVVLAVGSWAWGAFQVHAVTAGGKVALIDGRTVDFASGSAGVGIRGRLSLIADTCVSLTLDYDGREAVVLWPPGTSIDIVEGRVEVSSGEHHYSLGDEIDAGSDQGFLKGAFDHLLPPECASYDVLQLSLS